MLSFFITILISFLLSVILTPLSIPLLHRLKFGQEVREDGPKSHLKKQGTPTMGGVVFVLVISAVSLPFAFRDMKLMAILLLTLGFALTGFIDDYLKVVKHQSEGFNPKQKFLMQLVFTLLFSLYLWRQEPKAYRMFVPFTSYVLDLRFLSVPACLFIVTATDNGSNFTDGLDGLCSSVTAVIAFFLGMVSLRCFYGETAAISGAVVGALFGFLCYNSHPAKLFMGDTGSLALGGYVAATAFLLRIPLFIPIFAFIYLLEVLSVILQVSYFKATHGKRIFKMAPIHHHFELSGWSETRVVTVFTIITVLLCLISYLGIMA